MQSLQLIIDRTLEKKLSDLSTAVSQECNLVSGLLIGHRTSSAIYVVHLARNFQIEQPDDENSDQVSASRKSPPKRSAGKSSPPHSLRKEPLFNENSMLQHIRQTVRMLPGGLDIVGFYYGLSVPGDMQMETTASINRTLRSAYKISTKLSGASCLTENEGGTFTTDARMILLSLQSPSGNKKSVSAAVVDCRPDVQSSAPSVSIPMVYQSLRWRSLCTRLIFDVPLFVPTTNGRDTFMKQFTDSVRPWCRRLWTAAAVVNGAVREDSEPLAASTTTAKGAKVKKSSTDTEMDVVDFYVTPMNGENENLAVSKLEKGAVSMHIRGTMYCVAFVHQKATVADGIRALKTDALRSLYGRCELHYDGMAVLEGEELDPVALHQFPRRVFAPLATTGMLTTDYLFEGDVSGDAVTSFKDLLDLDVTQDAIEDNVERIPCQETLEKLLRSSSLSTTQDESVENIERANSHEGVDIRGRKPMLSRNRHSLMYAVLAVIVAILSYLFYFMLGMR